jgi:hypothetical protein
MQGWDWVTISALATAAGTLVLAFATYGSVRSANRAARAAERSLLAELRPLLVESSEQDAPLHVGFMDHPSIGVPGGTAAVLEANGNLYVVLSLRNVGPGIAVLHGGRIAPGRPSADDGPPPLDEFRMLSRDIYIPSGKPGFWQIAFRDEQHDERAATIQAIERDGRFVADVLYGDLDGGQRVVTRFSVVREPDDLWHLGTVRHWPLDGARPR